MDVLLANYYSGGIAGQNVNRPGRDSVNFAAWARLVVRNSLLSDESTTTTHSVEGLSVTDVSSLAW